MCQSSLFLIRFSSSSSQTNADESIADVSSESLGGEAWVKTGSCFSMEARSVAAMIVRAVPEDRETEKAVWKAGVGLAGRELQA